MIVHTLPLNDTRDGEPFEHEEVTTCACGPRVEFVEADMLVIHNSFDGREIIEEAESILNPDA